MYSIRSSVLSSSAVAAVLILGGCAAAGHLAAPDTPFTGPQGAVQCATMHNPGQERSIGSEGGTLVADRHALNIPPQALNGAVQISFRHPPRNYVVVEGRPSGIQFANPATIMLSYEHCEDERPASDLSIWVWEDGKDDWQKIPSRPVQGQRAVQAEIGHFTSFALGST